MLLSVPQRLPKCVPPPPLPFFSSLLAQGYSNITSYLQRRADLELAEARKAEKAARSYDSFLNGEVEDDEEAKPTYNSVREMEEDFM
jgi:hypothetical protein